jgi:hypothetical protein
MNRLKISNSQLFTLGCYRGVASDVRMCHSASTQPHIADDINLLHLTSTSYSDKENVSPS